MRPVFSDGHRIQFGMQTTEEDKSIRHVVVNRLCIGICLWGHVHFMNDLYAAFARCACIAIVP